jgi:DNA-binding CsgD family transcriptional regulator/tetratricopeptide (TPR) repeat protein
VLTAALEEAALGRGSAIYLFGEAGSGKTRILRDLIDLARSGGMVALPGAASPLGGAPPFAPVAQAFRSNLRWRELPVREMESFAGGLRLLLPEWPAASAASDLDPPQLRLLAMESAVQLLARLGAARGCLLALEDVHWADVDTLGLLEHVAAVEDLPVLLVATLRTGEAGRAEVALEALAARGQGRILRLERLDSAGVREMAAAILGEHPSDSLLDSLMARSQGNPLLVEELLEADLAALGRPPDAVAGAPLTTDSPPIPRTMVALVADKLARLSEDARAVVDAAAVGADLDATHLSLVTGLDQDRTAGALRGAVAVGLLELTDGDLAFRHVLVVDAIREAMLPTERQRLHAEIAAALARRHGDDPAFAERRGAHLLRAGRPDEAWELLLSAGRWKLGSGSAVAAEATLRAALAAAPSLPARDACRAALAVALAEMGRWEDSLAVDRAAETVEPDAARLARMARAAAFCGRLEEADGLRARAEAAGADEAGMLALGALIALWRGQLSEARDLAERALIRGPAIVGPAVACEALDVLGRAADALGHRAEAAEAFDRWAQVAADAGLAMARVQARMERGNLDFMSGGPDDGLRAARGLAIQAGAYVSQALADLSLVWWLGHRGGLGEAVELAEEAMELCRRFHLDIAHHAAAAAGWAHSHVDPALGEPLLGRALTLAPGDADVAILVAWTRGDAALRRGDWDRAAEAYRHGCSVMEANPAAVPPPVPFMLVCALAVGGHAAEAETALAGARRSPALPRLYVNPQWLAVGEALTARSAGGFATATEAMRENSSYNRALALVLGSLVFGEAKARDWLPAALTEFEAARAETDAARCRRLMRLASIPVPRSRRVITPPAGRGSPLSQREAEVLDLVGRGLTNPEIAARLFLSVRTVESHLASLLRKLDVSGRPALIALAVRQDNA